jgi:hypothetical protein
MMNGCNFTVIEEHHPFIFLIHFSATSFSAVGGDDDGDGCCGMFISLRMKKKEQQLRAVILNQRGKNSARCQNDVCAQRAPAPYCERPCVQYVGIKIRPCAALLCNQTHIYFRRAELHIRLE